MNNDRRAATAPGLEARVKSLQQQVADLREDMQCLTRHLLKDSDRQQLPVTIKAAHDLMGPASWNAGDLAAAARKASATHPLLQVIAAHGAADGRLTAFGRLLSRCDGMVAGGLRLQRVGTDREGCFYTVVPLRLSPLLKPAAPLAQACASPHDGYSFVRSLNDPT